MDEVEMRSHDERFRTTRRRAVFPALTLSLAAALAAAAAPASLAQDAQDAPPPDVFGEVIEVRVVNVEVVVTDRDGNRVTGLGPESFRLRVDGEQVPIDYFSEVLGGELRRPAEGEPELPGVPTLGVAGGRVGTNYLVFVDDYFAVARDRDRVLDELTEDLSFLGPNDRMAVVAYDGSQVEMLTSWTGSERELRRALGDARARRAYGLSRLAERRSHDASFAGARNMRSFDTIQELSPEDRFYAERVSHQVERSVSAAVAALRGFAKPEGRKVMLLLSGGWPFSPAAYASDARTVALIGYTSGGSRLFRPLVDTANLLGYTLYPVDVPGLGGVGASDVEQGGRLLTGLRVDPEVRLSQGSPTGSLDREGTVQDSLYYLAEQTGGRPLINAGRLDALEEAAGDTRSYYWLGFTPDRQRDDRRHEIRVEVTEPGLRVRARDSFLDLSPDAERAMAVESALLFGEPAAEGSLPVEIGEIRPAGRRFVQVPLTVAIPLDAMTVLPVDGRWVVRAELRVAALDAQDRQSEVAGLPIELSLAEPPEQGSYAPFRTELKLRRAKQAVVVSLTDQVGGRSLSARVEVDP